MERTDLLVGDSLFDLSLSCQVISIRSVFKSNRNEAGVTNERAIAGLSEYIHIYGARKRRSAPPVSQIIYNPALKDLNARVA